MAAFIDSGVPGNGYIFHCPTVGRDERFLVCAFKRRKHMRGESFADTDCRCAMRGGACPITDMLHKEWREEKRHFFEATVSEKPHRLPTEIAEHMARIILTPSHAARL